MKEEGLEGAVAVRKLDWFASPFSDSGDGEHKEEAKPPVPKKQVVQGCNDSSRTMEEDESGASKNSIEYPYAWRTGELGSLLWSGDGVMDNRGRRGLVILGSDVIYDEGLTEAFFDVLKTLMPPPPPTCDQGHRHSGKDRAEANNGSSRAPTLRLPSSLATASSSSPSPVLYMALEKRFNFTIAELSVAATGYKALLRNVLDVTTANEGSSRSHPNHPNGGVISVAKDSVGNAPGEACLRDLQNHHRRNQAFEGVRLPLTFAQCFRYQRSVAMEMWEIRRRPLHSGIDC